MSCIFVLNIPEASILYMQDMAACIYLGVDWDVIGSTASGTCSPNILMHSGMGE